jgi:hypothetical protein
MNKQMIKDILAWLDAASDESIQLKQDELKRLLKTSLSDRKADIKFALRLVEEEVISRSEVMMFVGKQD